MHSNDRHYMPTFLSLYPELKPFGRMERQRGSSGRINTRWIWKPGALRSCFNTEASSDVSLQRVLVDACHSGMDSLVSQGYGWTDRSY